MKELLKGCAAGLTQSLLSLPQALRLHIGKDAISLIKPADPWEPDGSLSFSVSVSSVLNVSIVHVLHFLG